MRVKRQVYTEHFVKLGIDGGGGFLKVSLGVQETEDTSFSKSPPAKKILTTQLAKDSGVKRQLLVALAEDLPKNYNNIKTVLGLICTENVNFVISCDYKVANNLCGPQSHASSHLVHSVMLTSRFFQEKANFKLLDLFLGALKNSRP